MTHCNEFSETQSCRLNRLQMSEPPYLRRLRERRHARSALEIEARLRNPWRESKGRDGALEAWG